MNIEEVQTRVNRVALDSYEQGGLDALEAVIEILDNRKKKGMNSDIPLPIMKAILRQEKRRIFEDRS